MKTVSFILPKLPYDEAAILIHGYVKCDLLMLCGGYLEYNVKSACKMSDGSVTYDDCIKFEVAGEPAILDDVYDIARIAGTKLSQESVLFVTQHHDVIFIPCASHVAVMTNVVSNGFDVV